MASMIRFSASFSIRYNEGSPVNVDQYSIGNHLMK